MSEFIPASALPSDVDDFLCDIVSGQDMPLLPLTVRKQAFAFIQKYRPDVKPIDWSKS